MALGPEAGLFKSAYGIGNDVESEDGWVLRRNHIGLGDLARKHGMDEATLAKRLADARHKLTEFRNRRPRPNRDEKALVDWNGLAIAALAEAGGALDRQDWIAAAQRAFAVIESWASPDGTLTHYRYEGRRGSPALLDDYVQIARAALTLYEITGTTTYLARARAWADRLENFRDQKDGGYFQRAAPHEASALPPLRPLEDKQTPAGNAAAADLLAKLYYLTGEERYRVQAEGAIRLGFGRAQQSPLRHGAFLVTADTLLQGIQIVIVGRRDREATQSMLRRIWRTSVPGRITRTILPGETLPIGHPAYGKQQIRSRPTAYVCKGTVCSLPTTNPAELETTLKSMRKS